MKASLARILIRIAEKDLDVRESEGRNRGPGIEKFWTATTYPDGYRNREPYCAAAVCYWISEAARHGIQFCAPLPTDASVRNMLAWARRQEKQGNLKIVVGKGMPGDLAIFLPHFSHVGLVTDLAGKQVETIEANTVPRVSAVALERDGGGVFRRMRTAATITFVRLFTKGDV